MQIPANMTLRQLRYFAEAAELGQFSQAARKLHVSQSVITTAVAQLEASLGLKLFDRMPHGVGLTAEGTVSTSTCGTSWIRCRTRSVSPCSWPTPCRAG
ncbi:LysR family transcriptional regulator [Stenotrophomonas rhizophila]